MSAPVTSNAEVIADRYLTSPASLRSRPFGPVDALDTHAGRAAQVRIVFASGQWEPEQLSETVARWCGIGTAGVIGVLDFGDHDGHPFLVLPPSLGMPLERWRAMRRPSAVDAARLALGFGRLIEAVSAAGFGTDVAEPSDFGIGPGPTPFLELPLLGRPDAPAILHGKREGQGLIARLYSATVWESDLPIGLSGWLSRSSAGEFESLAACLDALEAAASAVADAAVLGEPLGVKALFDRPLADSHGTWASLRGRVPDGARWAKGAGVAVAALLLATQAVGFVRSSPAHQVADRSPARVQPKAPVTTKTPAATATPVKVSRPKHKQTKPHRQKAPVKHHRHSAKPHRTHHVRTVTPPVVTPPSTPTTTAPPSSPSPGAPRSSSGYKGTGLQIDGGGGSRGGSNGSGVLVSPS